GSNDAAQIGGSDTADLTETDAAQSTGGTLTVSDVDSPATFVVQSAVAGSNGYGTFSLDAGGGWSYTMSSAHDEFVAGTTYTDSFTASTADGTTRRVTVTITGSNDIASLGSDAGFITETDLSQAIGGSLTLTDPDAVAASVVAQSDTLGTYGHFSIDASGTWTYATAGALDALAAGQVVSDVFNVATTDGGSATVTITLTGTNDAPTVASPIAGQRATQDSAFRFTLPAGSFADVDTGDSLGYSATGLPAWLSFDAATRTFSGTPANADVGRVSITVTATDASSAQASTRFDLTVANVNDDPVALADSVSTAEDTPLTFDPTANDSDVDGDVLIVAAVTQGAHGRVSVVDGAIRYMPDADFHGADSFSYVVSDGQGGSATARVSVTVTPVDDLPQAADDAWTTREDEALTGSVADNDSPSGDGGNRWTLVTGPSHGSLVLAGDGSFRYTPDPDFHGSDSFSYALADADGDRATARVAIEVTPVNDAPVLAGGDALAVDVAENITAVTTLAATDVDRPAQALQYSIVGGADRALFAVDAASGVLRFIAPPDFDAPADANADNVYELIVQVSDGFATASQTLAVTVANRNEMPAGSDGRIDMAEDGSHVFTLADFGFRDVLDSAPNQLAAVQIVVLPGQGALQLAGRAVEAGEWVAASDIAAGRLTYQPAPDANGHDYATLLFRVRDDGGTADGGVDTEAASHTLHIDVAAVNDAPVITRVAFELPAGSRIVLGADAIVAADVDSALASLGYIVDTATGGHFELLGAPGEAIAAFSQAELSAGRVVFVHDGAAAPLVVIRASDGQADSGAVRAAISLQVSAPGASTSPTANPQQPPVTTVTPAAPKPAEADKATKMPAFLPSRPGVLEGLAPAPNPASAGDGVVRLGRDGAGNADPASRVRNQILGGPPRLERAPVQLSLGGGVEGPLMDFLLRGDGLVASTGSAGSALRMGDGGQRDALQERDGEVDVRVVLQAIELTGVALSVGAVWWATRAGALVASLLVSVPAWRNFDPLMVLGPEDENDRDWAGVMDDQAVQDEMGIAEVFDAGMEVRP
uniref:Ig-like domain-containing protein n=1 Tax=Zoogloea sp. TaxID=49181 RepID=UPI0035B013C7